MLQKLNQMLERAMPFITPVSVVIGVLLASQLKPLSFLVPWIFAAMTFAGSLNSDLRSLGRVLAHPFPILIALVILHVWMPLWAWGIGHLAFPGDSLTITGLILGMVIPTGITSFVWVSIYKGNHSLALSIILIDTLLSPFIVPNVLALFAGKMVDINQLDMMKGLLYMIVLPSLLGMLVNQWRGAQTSRRISSKLAPFSKIGLSLVVMINSSVVAPYLVHIHLKLVYMAFAVCLIAFSGYLFSRGMAKWLKWERDQVITLSFCGGMRNISAGAVIAIAYFPEAVAIPVVLGMLFQQILASLNGHMLSAGSSQNESQLKQAQ